MTEATDAGKELYGMKRLEEVLNRHAALPPEQLLAAVKSDIDSFVGEAEQFDDITMLGMIYKKKAGRGAKKVVLDARLTALGEVTLFVNRFMEQLGCDEKTKGQTDIAVEEIFANICHYAYPGEVGKVTVEVKMEDGKRLVLTFSDSGVRYNPLEKPDPDITLGAQEREIGGLGIYMVKNIMDEVSYRYEDGKNILTMVKQI